MKKQTGITKTSKSSLTKVSTTDLFDRVVSILEQARNNVTRSVNSNMVIAYWLIGREIVEEIQKGKERAEYGQRLVEQLSEQLQKKYGTGFSLANIKRFRQFYQVYSDRLTSYPTGSVSLDELAPCRGANSDIQQKILPPGRELTEEKKIHLTGGEMTTIKKSSPIGSELLNEFNPQLSWSHYRALMRVKNQKARDFYEYEAAECGWSKTQLERQIQTSYYERIIAHHGEKGLRPDSRKRLAGEQLAPIHVLKSPMVLEFLDLPDSHELHESEMEQAIINNLQSFLLELGKGFSFVARQKHIRFDDDDFYVDLVFYNFILKCFLLIDLKLGKLTHADIGQMDGYVRLFEDRFKLEGDNPTIGLILCSSKSKTVAKYSVLHENKQIFASKYMAFLPTEKEISLEIAKERKLIEAAREENSEAE